MHLDDYIAEKAPEFAGNWQKFESFAWRTGYREEISEPEKWGIHYPSHRDSDLLSESNAHALEEAMEPFVGASVDDPDALIETHSHWGVGYLNAICVRVYDKDGNITEAFKAFAKTMMSLEDYPILDEEDYSRRELEATLENIENEGKPSDEAPEDWASEVYRWLSDNEPREIENSDGHGGSPSRKAIARALWELSKDKEHSWLDEDYAIDYGFIDEPEGE